MGEISTNFKDKNYNEKFIQFLDFCWIQRSRVPHSTIERPKNFKLCTSNHKLKFIPILCTTITYVNLKWEELENLCALFSIDDMYTHCKFCLFKLYKCVSHGKKYYVKSGNIGQGTPSTTTCIKWNTKDTKG